MAENRARAGDELVLVACCGRGPVAVLAHKRPSWRCVGCKTAGFDLDRLTLGQGGALPEITTVGTAAAGTASSAENGGMKAVPAVAAPEVLTCT